MPDMESIVPGSGEYETWNPATAVPLTGTDICGFPREGVRLSFTGSHVEMDGCRLKSVNHSQEEETQRIKAETQRVPTLRLCVAAGPLCLVVKRARDRD